MEEMLRLREEKHAKAENQRRRNALHMRCRGLKCADSYLRIFPTKNRHCDWVLGDDWDPENCDLPREEWEYAVAEKSCFHRLGYRPGGPLLGSKYEIYIGWSEEPGEAAKELPGTSSEKPADALQAAKGTSSEVPEVMSFKLSGTCKLILLRTDIRKWEADQNADAIVNFLDDQVVGDLQAAVGPDLMKPLCGERKRERMIFVTEGLPTSSASKIIHAGGPYDTKRSLEDAYLSILELGRNFGVQYIAFPDTPSHTYSIEEAARITVQCLKNRACGFKEIYIIVGSATWNAWQSAAQEAWPLGMPGNLQPRKRGRLS